MLTCFAMHQVNFSWHGYWSAVCVKLNFVSLLFVVLWYLTGAIISVKKEAEKKAEHLQIKVDKLQEENKKLRDTLGEAKVQKMISLNFFKRFLNVWLIPNTWKLRWQSMPKNVYAEKLPEKVACANTASGQLATIPSTRLGCKRFKQELYWRRALFTLC